jgi:hypothetical protein
MRAASAQVTRGESDMTTRITPEDLAGTSERGKAAYRDRLRSLRARGIPLPAGVIIDKPDDIYDLDPEADASDTLDAFDAELKDLERADAKAQVELRAAGWAVPDGRTH